MRKNTAPPFIKGAQEIRTLKPALGTDADHCVFMDKAGYHSGERGKRVGRCNQESTRPSRARPTRGPAVRSRASCDFHLSICTGEARRVLKTNPQLLTLL